MTDRMSDDDLSDHEGEESQVVAPVVGDEVQVKFFTRSSSHKVQSTPFSVPSSLGRSGLSGILNHLCRLDPPVPFEFLVNNELLRTSLRNFLVERRVSTEAAVLVEYVEAAPPPQHRGAEPHDDWVSCVSVQSTWECLATGSYDGIVRVFDSTKTPEYECIETLVTPQGSAVKSVAFTSNGVIAGGKDPVGHVWKVDPKRRGEARLWLKLEGHTGSIDSVAVSPERRMAATGSWDSSIRLWNVAPDREVDAPDVAASVSRKSKRRRVGKKNGDEEEEDELAEERKKQSQLASTVECERVLAGHTRSVGSLSWIGDNTLMSGGWDRTLRRWDVEAGVAPSAQACDKAILCMAAQVETGLAASGHHDAAVRVWDLRSNEGEVIKLKLHSHRGWVSSVAWHPSDPRVLATTSYDQSVKLWDIRSRIPLHTMPTQHDDKGLCVAWLDARTVVSGGADSQLHTHQVELLAA